MTKLNTLVKNPYFVHSIVFVLLIVFSFVLDTPSAILKGVREIVTSRDMLITDYIEIAGVGGTLINVSIIGLISVGFLMFYKVPPTGYAIATLWLMAGYSFFGKSFVNIWPIFLGGYIYAKVKKEPFKNYVIITLLATALSPAVSYLALDTTLPRAVAVLFGVSLGVIVGFVIPPIASACMRVTEGFNLYNAGFATGIAATALASVIRIFGVKINSVFIWNTTHTLALTIVLCTTFVLIIIIGLLAGEKNKENYIDLLKHSGKASSDYYLMYKETTYINMGILGLFGVAVTLALGQPINGPSIGGIFAMVGYAAYGKHIKNIIPIMIGATIGGLLYSGGSITGSVIMGILFCTTLAPIAGVYGYKIGIFAGFMHMSIVLNTTSLHGGLNLYNNGLAGGLLCMFLIPILTSLNIKRKVD